jgi:hypothetical protein
MPRSTDWPFPQGVDDDRSIYLIAEGYVEIKQAGRSDTLCDSQSQPVRGR